MAIVQPDVPKQRLSISFSEAEGRIGDEPMKHALHAANYLSTAAAETGIAIQVTLMDSTWFDRGGMNKHLSKWD